MIDDDTFTSPDTGRIARLAAGAAVVGVEQGSDALVLVRPPGHHAEPGQAMGFCFYNNVAIAAAAARAAGAARVAVVDIDVHHGNGTERMFYGDRSVLFISTHQWPLYPGTGAATDIGSGDGLGHTVNIPIEAGASDGDYLEILDAVVAPVLADYAPELGALSRQASTRTKTIRWPRCGLRRPATVRWRHGCATRPVRRTARSCS